MATYPFSQNHNKYFINEEEDMNQDYGFFYILDTDYIPTQQKYTTRKIAGQPLNPPIHTRAIPCANSILYTDNIVYTIIYKVFKWIFD